MNCKVEMYFCLLKLKMNRQLQTTHNNSTPQAATYLHTGFCKRPLR